MDVTCGTYGGGEVHCGFWLGNLKERGHLEKLGIDKENSIKMGNEELDWEGVDGIDLAQDRDEYTDVVNTVMNHLIPLNVENFLTKWGTFSFSKKNALFQGFSQLFT